MASRSLFGFASAIIILNLVDALFTLVYTGTNIATESNPLMSGPLTTSPVWFVTVKLALVSLCVLLLWRNNHRRLAVLGLYTATAAYSLVLFYHLSAVPLLIAAR